MIKKSNIGNNPFRNAFVAGGIFLFIYRLKNCIAIFLSVLVALLFCIGVRYANVSKLSALKGERAYYLDSASSQGLQKSTLSVRELFRVRGESVIVDIHEFEGGMYATNEELARAIAEQYGAKLHTIEEACGVISYYGYTPRWQEGVFVQGVFTNLHIAIGKNSCAVGTPIIFGGF